jgi:hypothetical protein
MHALSEQQNTVTVESLRQPQSSSFSRDSPSFTCQRQGGVKIWRISVIYRMIDPFLRVGDLFFLDVPAYTRLRRIPTGLSASRGRFGPSNGV